MAKQEFIYLEDEKLNDKLQEFLRKHIKIYGFFIERMKKSYKITVEINEIK